MTGSRTVELEGLATLLCSVAVGNCLPSTTKTACADIGTFVPTLAEFVPREEVAASAVGGAEGGDA